MREDSGHVGHDEEHKVGMKLKWNEVFWNDFYGSQLCICLIVEVKKIKLIK